MTVFTIIIIADEDFRVNLKQAVVKGCIVGAAKDVSSKVLHR